MKQWLPLFFSFTLLATASLKAESAVNLYGYGSETVNPIVEPETPGKPFFVSFNADAISCAHFDHKHFHKKRIGYWSAEAAVGSSLFYNAKNNEALSLSLSYWRDRIEWKHNPFFKHQNFDNVTFSVGFFSYRVPDWLWRGQVGFDMDATYGDFWRYTFYDLLLWGRFNYAPCLGFHIGFVAQTGQRIDHVYPIIGVDWTISDQWKINAVFPVEMSVVYTINKKLSLALAGRLFEVRHRLRKDDRLHRGLVEYRNTGLELGVNYAFEDRANINFHIGEALGGHFKLQNQRHHRVHRLKFKSSPYIGGEVEIHF